MLAYDILEIDISNNDKSIRSAYLGMVKRYPPETKPAEFQVIQKAYDLIRTEQKRVSYFLFGSPDELTFQDYETVRMNVQSNKKITNATWSKLCQLYQEQKF
mgnify:CR=1 FL=1